MRNKNERCYAKIEKQNRNYQKRKVKIEKQNRNYLKRKAKKEKQKEKSMKKMPEIRALLNRPWKNKKIYLLLYNHVHQNVALFTQKIIKNS